MDQQVKVIPSQTRKFKVICEDPWWEERTDSLKFAKDHHMYTVPFVYLHSHTHHAHNIIIISSNNRKILSKEIKLRGCIGQMLLFN